MKKYSISKKVLIIFLVVTTIIVVSTFLAAVIIGDLILKQTSIDYSTQLVSQVDNAITGYQEGMRNISEAILTDKNIHDHLFSDKSDTKSVIAKLKYSAHTRKDITNIFLMKVNPDKSLAIVFDDEKKIINPYVDYYESEWYKQLVIKGVDSFMTSSYVQNLVAENYDWVISLGVSIRDSNGDIAGIILIDLNYSAVQAICDDVIPNDNGYIYILSEDGQIVYHPSQQLIFNNVVKENTSIIEENQEDYIQTREDIFVVIDSKISNWKTVAVLNRSKVFRYNTIYIIVFSVFGCVFIGLSVVISVVFSKWFTKPILALSKNMKKVQAGDLTVRVDILHEDEIGELGESFNIMTKRIDDLLKRIIIEQDEKRSAELNALRAQIKPHFLYNTLDSIIWMAECERNEEVVDMVSALSKMLRATISQECRDITLKHELQSAENYLKIQKLRYANKLDYAIDVAPKLLNRKVAHLILQPIIENAIYHGIKSKTEGGKVIIHAYERKDYLVIVIEDNGIGMERERVKKAMAPKDGIGLYNVNKRIKLLYGNDYGIKVESKEFVGTKIIINLPIIEVSDLGGGLFESQLQK